MDHRLQDKVAIITGAASGIGAGTAEVFAERGARLILVDRDQVGLENTVRTVTAGGAEAVACPGDVTERSTPERAVKMAIDQFGRLDIVFNNAGVTWSGEFTEFSEDRWDQLMAINLRSMFLMCKVAIPQMLRQASGSIVNTSSVMATLTEPGHEAYTTSKAGIVGLTKAVAVSYAPRGIRVNCIHPGWVDTPMNYQFAEALGGLEKLLEVVKRQQPLPRMITTREVANAVAFLASDEASGITGASLYVDGGSSAAI